MAVPGTVSTGAPPRPRPTGVIRLDIDSLISSVSGILWSLPLIGVILLAGVIFTVRTGAVQVRGIPDMIRQLFGGEKSSDGTSSFQSLMMSLANRVGTGNIAGVATAIAAGGPGAVFWMWFAALLGAATSFIESTLGQIYKERDPDTGEYRGGPAYYFTKGFAHRSAGFATVYGVLFAAVTIVAMSFTGPGVQSNAMSTAINNAFGVPLWIVAIFLMALLALIIIGGVKRIAAFASFVVPPMAVLYMLLALVVLVLNFDMVPTVFGEIFGSAFGFHAVYGAIWGLAIKWGVQRGLYSNEAGQGSGPHHAAVAEVSHPAKQGFVQAFAVYIDTLLVCSATAFIILSTDMFAVFEGETHGNPTIHVGEIGAEMEPGPGYVQGGFDTVVSGLGSGFVAVALFFFAFTTLVAFYYMAEVNMSFLTRNMTSRTARRVLIRVLQLITVISVGYGAVNSGGSAWGLADIGVGAMAWLNVLGILLLHGPAVKALKDYYAQKKQGVEPQFDPRPLAIPGADFWETRADQRVAVEAAGGIEAQPEWGADVSQDQLNTMIDEVEGDGQLSEESLRAARETGEDGSGGSGGSGTPRS